MQTQPQALQKAASSPLASVRQRAAKVLGLLGVQSAAAPAPGPAAKPGAAAPAAAPVPDLMGGFDEEPAAAPFASGADMLGEPLSPRLTGWSQGHCRCVIRSGHHPASTHITSCTSVCQTAFMPWRAAADVEHETLSG